MRAEQDAKQDAKQGEMPLRRALSAPARASTADFLRSWATQQLEAAGVEDPPFEAQLLLAHALNVSRTQVLAGLHAEPTYAQRQAFRRLVRARARRVPLAYLRGTQEFYGLPFVVSPAVLIPRPETELLVDFARETLNRSTASLLADIGTGSGCIAIATLAHCPHARAVATDISVAALAVAARNAAGNGVTERLRFVRANLLDGLGRAAFHAFVHLFDGSNRFNGSELFGASDGFDCIVANPPYIPSGDLPTLLPEVRDFEPRHALDGGADGQELLRGLARAARRALRPGGWLAMEVAMGQAAEGVALLRACGLSQVTTRRDLAGTERMICGQAPWT